MHCSDGSWTVENGKYPGNWLGLWTPANGYRDGEEIACNKNGSDISRLQIFAISKKRFHTDFLPTDREKDATPLIVNPTFTGNGFGWTMTGTWGNQRYNGAVEVWHSTDFHYTQTIGQLPNGVYAVTCQMANGEGQNTGYLYATSGQQTETATVAQSCAGSNFDAERDKMANNKRYGLLSVEVEVADGSLTIGIREPSAGNTWLVWDNFTLTYKGDSGLGIKEMATPLHDGQIYDLQGRRLNAIPQKGFYIINGKKYVR